MSIGRQIVNRNVMMGNPGWSKPDLMGPMGGTRVKNVGGVPVQTTVQKTGRGYTVTRNVLNPTVRAPDYSKGGGNVPPLPQLPGSGGGGNNLMPLVPAIGRFPGGPRGGGGGTPSPGGGGKGQSQSDFKPTYTMPSQPGNIQNVYQDFQNQQQQANQANEQRYQQILGGYGQLEQDYATRTQQLSSLLSGYGDAQREKQQMGFEKQAAGLTQDVISRGMFGTSAFDAQRRAMERNQRAQGRQLEDQLTREKMGYMKDLTGEELQARTGKLDFMERREDMGPAMDALKTLAGLFGMGLADTPDYLGALGGQQGGGGMPGGGGPGGGGFPTPGGGGGSGPSLPDPNLPDYNVPSTRDNTRINVTKLPGGGGGGGGRPTGGDPGGGGGGTGDTTGPGGEGDSPIDEGPPDTGPTDTPEDDTTGGGDPGKEPPVPPGGGGGEDIPQPPNAPNIPPDKWKKLRGEGEPYKGGGVYHPNIPYPVNIAGMDWDMMQQTSPWPGSQTSEIRWRNYMLQYSKLFGGGDKYNFDAGSPTTY